MIEYEPKEPQCGTAEIDGINDPASGTQPPIENNDRPMFFHGESDASCPIGMNSSS